MRDYHIQKNRSSSSRVQSSTPQDSRPEELKTCGPGFHGSYFIYDLPAMLLMQRFWLRRAGIPAMLGAKLGKMPRSSQESWAAVSGMMSAGWCGVVLCPFFQSAIDVRPSPLPFIAFLEDVSTTRSKDATRGPWPCYEWSKKLLTTTTTAATTTTTTSMKHRRTTSLVRNFICCFTTSTTTSPCLHLQETQAEQACKHRLCKHRTSMQAQKQGRTKHLLRWIPKERMHSTEHI